MLRAAEARAQLAVQAGGSGVDGVDDGGLFHGGRSTGTHRTQRFGAREDEPRVATEPCGLAEHGGGLECVMDAL